MLARTIPSLLVVSFVLSAPCLAQHDWLLEVDPVASGVTLEVESSLGPVQLVGGDACPVNGTVLLELQGGVLPLEHGCFHGGAVDCLPSAVGLVPNVLRHLPPLLEIDFANLRLAPSSQPFPLASNGGFHLDSELIDVDGSLVVRLLGHVPLSVPLLGATAVQARTLGTLTLDEEGLRLTRSLGLTVHVEVPALALWLDLHLRGALVANLRFEGPEAHCTSSSNSVGLGALIELQGTASATLNDCLLSVVGCPPNSRGLFFYGSLQAEIAFGNGVLCTGGSLVRLPALRADAFGSASLPLDLAAGPHAQHLVPGSRWSFQYLYRDPAGGGARFNTSDALNVLVYP